MGRVAPMVTVEVTAEKGAPAGTLAARLLAAGFKLTLDLLPEDEFPSDQHTDSPETLAEMQRLAESGEPWAWFIAKVTISHPDVPQVKGHDYLGACSGYTPETWFAQDGYWPSMVSEAWDDYCTTASAMEADGTTAARLAGGLQPSREI